MALPKHEVKTYNLTLPSTGEEIKYRPFLVKEQKTLLMAQESKKDDEIVDAMSQLINDCTFGKVDPKTAPMFDVEYIFLKVRTQSVGSKVEMVVTCPDDNETKVNVSVNIDEVECNMTEDHSNIVEITDTVKLIFNYPLLNSFKNIKVDNRTESLFNMINQCIKEIHYGENIYHKIDVSDDDLTEFVESLSSEQFKKVSDFFETMPRLRHPIEVTNPQTKVKSEIVLEGLQTFLV